MIIKVYFYKIFTMNAINAIIQKPKWEKKIQDPIISKKWKKELGEQGAPEKAFSVIKSLLESYQERQNIKYDYNETQYEWFANIMFNASDFDFPDCECGCIVCVDGNLLDSDEDDWDDDESDDSWRKECIERSKIPCECKNSFSETMKKYLLKMTDQGVKVGHPLQARFIQLVNQLKEDQSNQYGVDYHPGSNQQVIDIIHPSLYCYVNGISMTRMGEQVKQNLDSNLISKINQYLPDQKYQSIFQWLPSDFHVSYTNKCNNNLNPENEVKHVEIKSPINNLDRTKYPELYNCIGDIFKQFVPGFNKVLHNVVNIGKMKSYSNMEKCQVIVKIGRTQLEPENPDFSGGSWHLEGMPREKIVATGIYYFDMDNITTNELEFRATTSFEWDSIPYPQGGWGYVERHYNINDNGDGELAESIFKLGSVKTQKDLCLVFPNFFQHKVSSFSLVNKQKKGYRDILVFFLVDPNENILSTADVKSQQSKMSLSDAKFYRELLMFERKYETDDQSKFYERGWSLCEH